jgi:hypothetical protein
MGRNRGGLLEAIDVEFSWRHEKDTENLTWHRAWI